MSDLLTDTALPLMPPSPGALIKSGRERAGVHLAVLSVNMKVSIKQLEALESDRFDLLSGPVFSRALAAKVCRFLKMDPQPVLDLMPVNTNGLKPLNIIGSEQQASFPSNRNSQQGPGMGRGLKFLLLIMLLALLTFAFQSDWLVQVIQLNAPSQSIEVVPTMPPVQEPVLPEPAQAELPKAMVFESAPAAANAQLASPNAPVNPTVTNVPALPTVPAMSNVTSENQK